MGKYTYTIIAILVLIWSLGNMFSMSEPWTSEDMGDYYSSNMTVYYSNWEVPQVNNLAVEHDVIGEITE